MQHISVIKADLHHAAYKVQWQIYSVKLELLSSTNHRPQQQEKQPGIYTAAFVTSLKIIPDVAGMYWRGWDSSPSGLLLAAWRWVECVQAGQSTLCTAAGTHCTTPSTPTTFHPTKSHSQLTAIKQTNIHTTQKDYSSIHAAEHTSKC